MKAEIAVDTRIDVPGPDGVRTWKRGIISFRTAQQFSIGYKFDCFEIEVIPDGTKFFLPACTVEKMICLMRKSEGEIKAKRDAKKPAEIPSVESDTTK